MQHGKRPIKLRAAGVAVLLSGMVAVLGIFGDEGFYQARHLRGEIALIQKRVDALSKENATLRLQILQFEDNPFWIEKIAREQLGLVRPGEQTYRLKRANSADKNDSPTKSRP